MKPTRDQIEAKFSELSNYDDYGNNEQPIQTIDEEAGVKLVEWAISQMQAEWVSVEDELPGDETYAIIWRKGYSPEQTVARQVFNMTHACYCFIDNSLNTYQIGEVVTHWSPMLEPPTK